MRTSSRTGFSLSLFTLQPVASQDRLKPVLLSAAGEEHAGEAEAGEDERRRLWDGLEREVDVAAEPANSAEHPHASRMT